MENEQLMSGGQVAKYLQLNQSTIYDVAQKGEVPAIKLGQIWCFRRAELDVWLEAQKVKQKLKRNNSRGGKNFSFLPHFFSNECPSLRNSRQSSKAIKMINTLLDYLLEILSITRY